MDDHDDGDGPGAEGGFGLRSQVVGGLPIINRVIDRLGLPVLLGQALGEGGARVKLPAAAAIRLVVTNLVLGREPLYALGEWAARHDPVLLGLTVDEVGSVNDDRVGRALETLFDADRASLLTAVVLRAVGEFDVDTGQLPTTPPRFRCTGTTAARPAPNARASPRRQSPTAIPRITAPTSNSWCGS